MVLDPQQVVELVVLELFDHDAHDLLLTLHTARVAAPVVAEAAVRDGLLAVHVILLAAHEMDVQVAPRVVVVHRLVGNYVDAADRVDELFGRIDAQGDVAIEARDPEELRDDLLRQFRAAERERRC